MLKLSRLLNTAMAPCNFLKMTTRAVRSRKAAVEINCPGLDIDAFGRRLGLQLLLKGRSQGIEYLLHPVTHVRYFEYSFVSDCLPNLMHSCLDVSSPRLFSLYTAKCRNTNISMINPDPDDVMQTEFMLNALNIQGIDVKREGVSILENPEMTGKFDAVWSISVIEHIDGCQSDSDAVRLMYNALKKNGRLILTFPVDREFHAQSSKSRQYGTQPMLPDGTYFFQRFYDQEAIKTRISSPVGKEPDIIRWFGEKERGWYNRYVNSISGHGSKWAVEDVKEIAENFREYDSWNQMPGMGICGVMYEKS